MEPRSFYLAAPKASFAFYLPRFTSKAHAAAFAAAVQVRLAAVTGVLVLTTGQVLLGSSDPELNTVEAEHVMLRLHDATTRTR